MEIPNNELEENPDEIVDIYSKNAILWFSILFNPVFGAALLYQNLKDVGYNKEAVRVLTLSIVYTLLVWVITGNLPVNNIVLFLLITLSNISAGFYLSRNIFPKYFPDQDYYPKSVLNVALRSVLISVILALALGYLQQLALKYANTTKPKQVSSKKL